MAPMPVYEYACTACGERTEAKQSFTDPPLEECQVCGGKLRKLYSPVGIVFKGSGFYSTDAKKKSSTSGSASTSDGGNESRSAAKSDKSADKEAKKETPKKAEKSA